MQKNHTHIITSAGWHTAFENKERAGELQEKLSNWCHWQMPREINAVFDKMCPPDQVWRINTVALDLGTIDLDDLETILTARFRNRLYEKMKELVYYAGRPGDNAIEIVDRYTSLLETIGAFLVNGYLPWNALPMQGSISEWIALELRHNRQQLIALIRQVAAGNEQVRKRMAWQIDDPYIRKIIAGLEPAHHNEITDFADELVKLQKNNPVVKASTGDFSKNLWLWILNYLLDEKGTLFNKVAFLRSNIRQMAAHYNIQYGQLLQLLKEAVAIVQQKNAVKTHFVNMLLLVAQDVSAMPTAITDDVPVIDYWIRLKALLTNPLLRKTSAGALMLNELLVSLYHENPERLVRLLDTPTLPDTIWASIAPQLTADSVQVLFECFAPAKANHLLAAIDLLHTAAKQQQVVVNIKVLWQAGLVLLYKHRTTGCSETDMLQACIAALAKAKNWAPAKLYGLLLTAVLPSALYSPNALKVYGTLQQLCRKGLGQGAGETALQQQLQQLLAQLKQSLPSINRWQYAGFQHLRGVMNDGVSQPTATNASNANHIIFESGRHAAEYFDQLHSHLRSQPRAFYEALISLKDEALLLDTILPQLSNAEIKQLLQQAHADKQQGYAQLLALLQQAAATGAMGPAATAILQDKLPRLAVTILLLRPQLSTQQFIRAVLQQLLPALSSAAGSALQTIVATTLQGQHIATWLDKTIKTAGHQYSHVFNPTVWRRLKAIGTGTRQKLLSYLIREFNSTHFTAIRQQNGQAARALLQVLYKDAPAALNSWVAQYAVWLQQKGIGTVAATTPQLRHLFWKTLLHLPGHTIHTPALAQAFAATVAAYYACNWNDMPTQNSTVHPIVKGKGYKQKTNDESGLMNPANGLTGRFHDVSKQEADNESGITNATNGLTDRLHDVGKQEANGESVIVNAANGLTDRFHDVGKQEANITNGLMDIPYNQQRIIRLNGEARITEAQLFSLLEKSWLAQGSPVEYEGKRYTLGQLMAAALRTAPALLRSKLLGIAQRPHTAHRLAAAMGFHEFGTWIMHDIGNEPSTDMVQLTKLYALAERLLTGNALAHWEQQCWLLALQIIGSTTTTRQKVTALAAALLEAAAQQANASPAIVATQIGQLGFVQDAPFIHLLQQVLPSLATALPATSVAAPDQALAHAVENGLLPLLVQHLITEQTVPHWLAVDHATATALLNEILLHYPQQALQAWHPVNLNQGQLEWVSGQLDFDKWMQALIQVERARQAPLHIVQDFHRALGHITIKGIGGQVLQAWLVKKIMLAWQKGNWRILAVENIWHELLWKLHTQHGISQNDFVASFAAHRASLPPALQTAFTLVFEQKATASPMAKPMAVPVAKAIKRSALPSAKTAAAPVPTILVKNAGMVLLNSYVPLLLERLGLLHNKTFAQPEWQADAVHYLQYVVTGHTATEESFLPLNKLLCGLPLETPVKSGIDISPEQKKLIEGLLQAAINYWPAIGQNSLDGFRGNWLVRDGHLSEQDDNWHLLVDKRPYDILLGQSPFSFSFIKFPWMPKPLKVTWPY